MMSARVNTGTAVKGRRGHDRGGANGSLYSGIVRKPRSVQADQEGQQVCAIARAQDTATDKRIFEWALPADGG